MFFNFSLIRKSNCCALRYAFAASILLRPPFFAVAAATQARDIRLVARVVYCLKILGASPYHPSVEEGTSFLFLVDSGGDDDAAAIAASAGGASAKRSFLQWDIAAKTVLCQLAPRCKGFGPPIMSLLRCVVERWLAAKGVGLATSSLHNLVPPVSFYGDTTHRHRSRCGLRHCTHQCSWKRLTDRCRRVPLQFMACECLSAVNLPLCQ